MHLLQKYGTIVDVSLYVPGFALPPTPEGYAPSRSGLFVPKMPEDPISPAERTLNVIPQEVSLLARDPRGTEPAADHKKDPSYLWADAPSALNRLMSNNSLGTLQGVFGEMQQYSEISNVIKLLNGRPDSEEQLRDVTKEFYDLLASVHSLTSPDMLNTSNAWDFLDLMADYISIQHDMVDLPMTEEILELIINNLASSSEDNSKLLDFISHFDIPSEIASSLIDQLESNPNHPLYWWVASRCPNHPTVRDQREAVLDIIQANPEQMIDLQNIRNLMPLALLLPDKPMNWPRTGLELEPNTPIRSVKVPYGTLMGEDVPGTGKLELRLDHSRHPEVIDYGSDWLRRYFEIWRWEKISRSLSSSIHVHSELPEATGYHLIIPYVFGIDENDCRHNDLGTAEIRTALSGYRDRNNTQATGFSELPHPSFIELIHAVTVRDIGLMKILHGRLFQTPYINRLTRGGSANIATSTSTEHLEFAAITAYLDSRDSYVLTKLAGISGNLSPENQTRVVAACLDSEYSYVLRRLASVSGSLSPENQTTVATVCLASGLPPSCN